MTPKIQIRCHECGRIEEVEGMTPMACRCGIMQGHHKTYGTLGSERREDVEILCQGCHAQHHEEDGVPLADPVSAMFRAIMG